MRVMLVPMAAQAHMEGPFNRVRNLAHAFMEQGHEVVLCVADDGNWSPIDGTDLQLFAAPTPMGLPSAIGKNLLSIASKTGISARRKVNSFEEVQFLAGSLEENYFRESVHTIRRAIRAEHVDAVYSEFNLAAIAAAYNARVPVFTSYSFPARPDYASDPKLANGVDRVLDELYFPPINSSLDLFDYADIRFVASIPELEPIVDPDTIFVGSMGEKPTPPAEKRDVVLAYLGNGGLSNRRIIDGLTAALAASPLEIYIAGMPEQQSSHPNVHIAPHFDFDALWPRTLVSINHGGQNSLVDALVHGAGQICIPGKVFERRYNAQSIVENHAGVMMEDHDFNARAIKEAVETLLRDSSYRSNARKLGDKLLSLGGTRAIVDNVVSYCEGA